MLLPEDHRTEGLPGGKESHLLMRICSQDHKALPVEHLDAEHTAEGSPKVAPMNMKRGQTWTADQNTNDRRKETNH